jgi:hypothetical protein
VNTVIKTGKKLNAHICIIFYTKEKTKKVELFLVITMPSEELSAMLKEKSGETTNGLSCKNNNLFLE